LRLPWTTDRGRLDGTIARLDAWILELRSTRTRVMELESAPRASAELSEIGAKVSALVAATDKLEGLGGILGARTDALEAERKQMTLAIAEGIERVDRADRRIKDTVRRARKELADDGYAHSGLEAEASEFRPIDGAGGPAGGLQPVPGALEEVDEAPSTIPGVTLAQLRQIRGFHV